MNSGNEVPLSESEIEERFLQALRYQLGKLEEKVVNDFSEDSFQKELDSLKGDDVYTQFSFATPEYVLIRLMGRVSISIGRRLGEIYDKVPRYLAGARYGLNSEDVAPRFGGLELDIGIRYSLLNDTDSMLVKETAGKYLTNTSPDGVGIEIRYNFNPNDSARLRKDVDMVNYVRSEGLEPVYLVFSGISPRDDAIGRLKRAGWNFLVGQEAGSFVKDLLGLGISEILAKPKVQAEIQAKVDGIMAKLYGSYAVKQLVQKYTEMYP